jgi:hypothetical protein
MDIEKQKEFENAKRKQKKYTSKYEDLERFQHFKELFGVGEKKKDLFPIQGDDTTFECIDLIGVNLNTHIIESVVENLIEKKKEMVEEKFQLEGVIIDETIALDKEEFLGNDDNPKLSPRIARHNECIALEELLLAERKEKLNKMDHDAECNYK